jgi:hypothetical protein
MMKMLQSLTAQVAYNYMYLTSFCISDVQHLSQGRRKVQMKILERKMFQLLVQDLKAMKALKLILEDLDLKEKMTMKVMMLYNSIEYVFICFYYLACILSINDISMIHNDTTPLFLILFIA